MPTTPDLALPYPAGSDPADVPADMQALAEQIEAVRGAVDGIASLDGDGKVPTAQLPAVGGSEWTQVLKGSDESVTNTTIQNDDELFFTADNGTVYDVEIMLIYYSPAGGTTPDLKFDLGEDGTLRGYFTTVGLSTADAGAASALPANQTGTVTAGTNTTERIVYVRGYYVGAGGTFRVRWAQNTSSANATVVRANSFLRHRELA